MRGLRPTGPRKSSLWARLRRVRLRRATRSTTPLEKSLRLAEARLAGLISTTVDAIICIDSHQRITLFNEGAEHIFGYTAPEALGRPLDLLLPERYQGAHQRHIQQFAAGDQASRRMGERRTIIGRRKSGGEFPAEASISKVELDGALLLTVILRDISARMLAEQELRTSEERFRTAFADAPTGMALVGLDDRFLSVNTAMCDIVGYTPGELLARTFRDITWPEDLEQTLQYRQRLLSGEVHSYQLEKRYIHQQGHPVSILLTGSLVRDPHGKPLHFIAQAQDISQRKKLERAQHFLAEAGPRLASSLDPRMTISTVAGLAVPALADWCIVDLVDEHGQVQAVEAAAASPEKYECLRELLATHPRDPSLQGEVVARVLRTGHAVLLPESPEAAVDVTAEDGHRLELLHRLRPVSGLIVPLRAREQTLGAVILWTSESGRRYGESDLALAEALASRAALAIDNARLHEKSELATRLRDEVLRVVAHDLRTPLNVMALCTATLMKAPLEQRTATRTLETLRKAADRANRLIQDLLDVARMESGHLSVERTAVESTALVQEALDLHGTLAQQKSIQLSRDLPEQAPTLLVDHDRVIQILSNLLGNAIKFTPEGGHVSVQARPEGAMMRFSVRDTGQGIPPEHLAHVFEPFWQAQAGRKEGAGLGLAIVKGLVDAHGGRLWVESSPGLGSTFSFTLPTQPPAGQPRAQAP
ncbi:PAS domain S-box-containing protein [Myxococcus fulvus]|nr:PAS domain-containing sensor histidine kinase [Myxococcus fulvus]SET97402.1 PAS domain S-box-containing protein [Myxococcus fulvus]